MAKKIRRYICWRNKNVHDKLIIKEQNKIKVLDRVLAPFHFFTVLLPELIAAAIKNFVRMKDYLVGVLAHLQDVAWTAFLATCFLCARHGRSLTGESPERAR